MTQGRLPTRRRELNGLPSWWNHRLTFQAVRQWPCAESFQIIHGISDLFLCGWVYDMYAHMHRVHSQRTTMGCCSSPVVSPPSRFETESLTDPELRESLVSAHKALGFTSLHHQSLFRWVLGSALGSLCFIESFYWLNYLTGSWVFLFCLICYMRLCISGYTQIELLECSHKHSVWIKPVAPWHSWSREKENVTWL